MSLAELVLDQDDQLVEEKRLPGENTVSYFLSRFKRFICKLEFCDSITELSPRLSSCY